MATVKKRTWRTAKGEKREGWMVSYTDAAGKRQRKQFRLQRDANAFRVKAEGEVQLGIHTPDSRSITVAEACDLWIKKAVRKGRERGTIKGHKEIANLHIKPLLGKEKLSRLTMPKVEAFADALLETRSPIMARKVVRALSSVLLEAMRLGLVAQNVARGVKVEVSSRDEDHVVIPQRDHLRALIEAAQRLDNQHPELHPMILTVALAGLRSSELRGLAWPAIELKDATGITVNQRADAWGVIGAPKSKAGRRTIPIGPMLVAVFRAWKLRCPPSPLGLVFPNGAGRPLWQSALHEAYLALEIEAGLAIDTGRKNEKDEPIYRARYGLHCLRHAAASAWINQGVDLKRLQVWMGHSTIQITLDTYGHLITDAQKDAALATGAEAALLA